MNYENFSSSKVILQRGPKVTDSTRLGPQMKTVKQSRTATLTVTTRWWSRTNFASILRQTKPQTDEQGLRSSKLKAQVKRGQTLWETWAIVLTGQNHNTFHLKSSTSDSKVEEP